MKILVTGGAGYLGSNLVYELTTEGHECLIFDNFSTGHKHLITDFEHIQADIRNFDAVNECMKNFTPNVVVHLAGLATVGDCEKDPATSNEVNIVGTDNICKAMLENGVSKLVFASSAAVYKPSDKPLKTTSEVGSEGVYGRTKLDCEKLIKKYHKKGLNSVIFRMFNLSGAEEQARFGELHNPETHIIPLTIAAAFSGKEIKIFGNDYETKDGTAVRDYIHITDAALAFMKACEYLNNNSGSITLNLGSGKGLSVLEIIDKVSEVTGREIKTITEARRKGDEAALISDNSKTKKVLGWDASMSEINNIILTASKWHIINAE